MRERTNKAKFCALIAKQKFYILEIAQLKTFIGIMTMGDEYEKEGYDKQECCDQHKFFVYEGPMWIVICAVCGRIVIDDLT